MASKIECDVTPIISGGRVSLLEYIGPVEGGKKYHMVLTPIEPTYNGVPIESMSYGELRAAIDNEVAEKHSAWIRGLSFNHDALNELNAELKKRPVPLLYCPHCGSEEAKRQLSSITQLYHVRCNRCGSCGPGKLVAREADEAWNRRA